MLNLALAYSALIVVVSIVLAISLRKKPNRASIPNFATVLGILGTFGGILYGLWGFDVRDINGSIPGLLDGLRTAFITSVTGISTAVLLRGIFLGKIALRGKKDVSTTEGATLDTLADLLKNGFQEINANTAAVANAVTGEGESTLLNKIDSVEQALVGEGESTLISKIGAVERALTGEGDTTLLTQMQKMRTTFSDKQDDLIKEFREFAESMAENNSRALIEALEEVMRDFNAKINEQFGDNFKQLNEAVGQLLTWQENYKEQVEAMVGQLRQSMEALKSCEKAMGVVVERSETFAGVADRLEEALGELSGRNKEMNAHLEALASLGERAESAFPAIQQNIEQITDGLTTTANGFTESAGAALKTMENQRTLIETSQKAVNDRILRAADGFKSSVEASLTGMADQRERIEKNQAIVNAGVRDATDDFKSSVDASLESMSQQRNLMQSYHQAVNAQIQKTADGFKGAVEASLKSMETQQDRIEQTAEGFEESTQTALTSMENQRAQLEQTQTNVNERIETAADGFKNAADSALASMESQRRQIDLTQATVNTQIRTAVLEFANAAKSSLENMESQMELIEDFQRVQTEMSKSVQNASGDISSAAAEALRSIQDTGKRIVQAQDALKRDAEKAASQMTNTMRELVNQTAQDLMNQTKALDEQLGEELTKALNSLANQLTALSAKFVQDFDPLTEQLRRVVRIAENLDDPSPPRSSGTSRSRL